MKKTIRDFAIRGKRLLIRADFNVPIDPSGKIADDFRIRATLPTIRYAVKRGARVILMSHLGRPKGKCPEFSLSSVAKRLAELLGQKVSFLSDSVGQSVENEVLRLKNGEVALLENLRYHTGEEKNDPLFAQALARLGEIYVNDAFGAAHRAHASVEGVTKFLPSCAGLLLEKEIEILNRLLRASEKPFVVILGGAKVSDKIKVIENLLPKVDRLLIGGGMAYTFLKVQGVQIGRSKLDEAGLEAAKKILAAAHRLRCELLLPTDHVVAEGIGDEYPVQIVKREIPANGIGLDIGPETRKKFSEALQGAKLIFWNGPLGVFEVASLREGTREVAQTVASLTKKGSTSIIGGGDTVSAIQLLGLADQMSHLSTGGGASLEYLEGQVLPGIAALEDKVVQEASKR